MVLIVWVSVLLMVQGSVSWWWALPWAATGLSVFSYFRQRAANRPWVGVGWACAQAVFGIGAFCLVVLPAGA